MGHGTPDWWGSEPGETTFQVQDVGELAARLGSIDTFDRRGNVVFLEDFENGYGRWTTTAGSTNSKIFLSSKEAAHGTYSVAMYCAAEPGAINTISLKIPYPSASRIGVEVRALIPDNIEYFYITIMRYDGTYVHDGAIRYYHDETRLEYKDSAGNWQPYRTGLTLDGISKLFNIFKFVVDLEDDAYAFAMVNDLWDDLSDYSLRKAEDASSPYLCIVIEADGDGANATTTYVDSVILTQNEP